jgi:hypothetical protein
MASWRELAAAAGAKPAEPIVASVRDDWGLDPDLADSLRSLERLPAPRLTRPAVWSEIVRDALSLARDGWAAKALALGWSAHDLFATGPTNSDQFDGLAVWLEGRTIALLDEWKVHTTCGARFYREGYMRPNSPRVIPVYLWRFGRRR